MFLYRKIHSFVLKHSLSETNLEKFKHMTKFMHFCIVTLNQWDNLLGAKLYLDLSLYNFVAWSILYRFSGSMYQNILILQEKTSNKSKIPLRNTRKKVFFFVPRNFLNSANCIKLVSRWSNTMSYSGFSLINCNFVLRYKNLIYFYNSKNCTIL